MSLTTEKRTAPVEYSTLYEYEPECFYRDISEHPSNDMSSTPWNQHEISTFTNITELLDTMATNFSLTEDSSLHLTIDRTCDFVVSDNSSLESSYDSDVQCVPECSTRQTERLIDSDFPESTWCPIASSTQVSHGHGIGKQNPNSSPLASSTMIEDPLTASSGSNGSPFASCTVTEAPKPLSSPAGSADDLQSIFTWSINDTEETVFDETYINGHHLLLHPQNTKTVIRTSLSRSSDGQNGDRECPVARCDRDLVSESLYDDYIKTNKLPRTSTQLNLKHRDDFHIVPNCSDRSEGEIVQERQEPDLPQSKSVKIFKFPQLKKLLFFKKSKGKKSTEPKSTSEQEQAAVTMETQPSNTETDMAIQLKNKKAVIKKMKRFSANFHDNGPGHATLYTMAVL